MPFPQILASKTRKLVYHFCEGFWLDQWGMLPYIYPTLRMHSIFEKGSNRQ
jgi:hypothetical protein